MASDEILVAVASLEKSVLNAFIEVCVLTD